MKKEFKQILLMFLAIAMVATICASVIGCGGSSQTTDEPGLTLKPADQTTTAPTVTTAPGTTAPVQTTAPVATTTKDNTPVTTKPITPVESGSYINPLTGLKTSKNDPSNKRPIAVVIDNISNAYKNQKGLYQADILYEALVAPGITRYLAVIEDYESVKDICNVRSGRDFHIDIAMSHNAILVCHGGSINEKYDFYQLVANRLGNRFAIVDTMFEPITSWKDYGETYGTIQNKGSRRDLLHDTVVNGTALKIMITGKNSKFAGSGTSYKGAPNGFKFGTSSAAASSISAKTVKVDFTMDNNTSKKEVTFDYDASTGKYIRSQVAVNGLSGEQLSFTNVIFLGVDVTCDKGPKEDPKIAFISVTGAGKGYYCHGGKMIAINWAKSANGALVLTTENGSELILAAGNTYIGYLEKGYINDFPERGYHAN